MASKPTKKVSKNRGGRPEYEPNPYDQGRLHCALTYGMTQEEIESYMCKDIDTLKKHYPEMFATVKADRNGAVKKALFYQATKLNLPASTIFYLKTQCEEFQEKKNAEGVDGDVLMNFIASVVKERV